MFDEYFLKNPRRLDVEVLAANHEKENSVLRRKLKNRR